MGFRQKHDVVTIFGRKDIRPAVNETGRLTVRDVPPQICFTLPNGVSLETSTGNDIIIGRQARPDDPPVAVDLEAYDGHAQGVSRHHALIKQVNDSLLLCDLDSINGTFINEERALPLRRYTLRDGDVIRVGRIKLTVNFSC